MTAEFRFGPERRIKHRQDFLRVQQRGNKWRTKHLLICVSPRQAPPGSEPEQQQLYQSRLGVTVTTKVHKRAVRRNRFKRRVREIYRREQSKFQSPSDLVVIALQGATELDFGKLSRELKYLFYRSGLLAERRGRQKSAAARGLPKQKK